MTRHRGSDPAPALLAATIAHAGDGRPVLLLPEGSQAWDYGPFYPAGASVITGRWDIVKALEKRAVAALFCDYDLGRIEDTPGAVYFRVAKEKALVHHVINEAARRLPPGGTLHLAGMRNEGIKTYVSKAAALFGCEPVVEIRSGGRCAVLRRGERIGEPLPDQDYPTLRRVMLADGAEVLSKPGIFGWQKLDAGSALLTEAAEIPPAGRVLDLCCGYGYLGLAAHAAGAAEVCATDSNAAAIAATLANFHAAGITGEVIPSDFGDCIDDRFEVVLCNPPFHRGFPREDALRETVATGLARLVDDDGVCYVVTNRFVPMEAAAGPLFVDCQRIADDGRYTVLALRGPT